MAFTITLLFWALNLTTARFQAWWFDVKQKSISHFWWATAYLLVCLVALWYTRDIYLFFAIGVMRLPVFTTALNFWRIPRRPIFYTNWQANGGSKLDEIWKDAYPAVFFLTCIAYVVLQFFIQW